MKTIIYVIGKTFSKTSVLIKKVTGPVNRFFESDMYPEGIKKSDKNYDDFPTDVIMRGLHNAGLH